MARSAVLLKPIVANILLFKFCEQKFVQHGPITIAIDYSGLRRLFNVCVQVFCAPNSTILLVYIPCKIKMSFIWKDDLFFVAKIGIIYKSFDQSNVAIFPTVIQAYTQPYSFRWRIKLIICQIRHKLSVTINEISSSWKKVRWRTLYKDNF